MNLINSIKLPRMKNSIESKMPSIIISSLTIVAGLAWNDAIQSIINYYVPEKYRGQANVWTKLIYVIILTIIIIILIDVLIRLEKN